MVGDTLEIVHDLDENDARGRIALSSGEAVDVPDLQIVSQLVDLVLALPDVDSDLFAAGLSRLDRSVKGFIHRCRDLQEVIVPQLRELLVPFDQELDLLRDILRVVAAPLDICQGVEEVRHDQLLPVVQGEVVRVDQIFRQFLVDAVDALLHFKDLFDLLLIPAEAHIDRAPHIFQDHFAHAHHFVGKGHHCDGGLLEDTGIQMEDAAFRFRRQPVRFGLLDQESGQIHQLLREGEQKDCHGQLEAGVEQRYLHRGDLVARDLRPHHEQRGADHAEQDGADDVEGKVDRSRPWRRASR